MTTLNEQMREKARQVARQWNSNALQPFCKQVDEDILSAMISGALLAAHAAGRQEILAKLPSEREWMKHLDTELAMHHMLEAVSLENIWRVALYRLQVELEKK